MPPAALPTGSIRTPPPNGGSWGYGWERAVPLLPIFRGASGESGVPVSLLIPVGMIESNLNQTWPAGHPQAGRVIERWDAYPQDGPSVGLMQVKPRLWQSVLPDADAYDLEGNVRLGAALMARFVAETGSWQRAIDTKYFPDDDPNGTSRNEYVRTIAGLMDEIEAAAESAPLPDPKPKPEPDAPLAFGRVPHPPFRERPVENSRAWDDLGPRNPVGTCVHRMLGTLMGTDGYFRGAAAGSALTDYGIGCAIDGDLDGVILRWNDPRGRRSPWANGPANDLDGDGAAFVRRYGVSAVNRDLVSIELSGHQETPVSAAQFESLCRLIAHWHDQARVPWHAFPLNPAGGVVTQLQHWELGPKECPFGAVRALTDRYQARVAAIMREHQGGGATAPAPPKPEPAANPGYPEGMTPDLAAELFGTIERRGVPGLPDADVPFDPTTKGAISAAWLARGAADRVFPEADEWFVDPSMPGTEYVRFANGWLLVIDRRTEKRPLWWMGDDGERVRRDGA